MVGEEGKPLRQISSASGPANPQELSASRQAQLAAARQKMVDHHLRQRGIRHAGLLQAFAEIPRERFIPPDRINEAYADCPVPIGLGQTISQPYVVALMIEQLDPQPTHRVLDIGAGSGFQTAVLARLVKHVYAVERLGQLAEKAISILGSLNVTNVTFCTDDGSLGLSEEAPFDRIICAAATPEVPACWLGQLADGGKIVLPVGGPETQTLQVMEKHGSEVRRREICDVRFVKLIGRKGWPA